MNITVNYLAVLSAAVAAMIVGALWYSPLLFGRLWMQLSGITEEKLKELKAKGMGKSYALMFLCTLIMAFVLAHFAKVWNVKDAMSALQLAFWVWLGFIATVMFNSVLWEGKSVKLYTLNVAHEFVSIAVMSLILVRFS